MGRRGPKPKPTEILQARGSWRADARIDEPQMPEGLPTCPAWLKGEARKHWFMLMPMLAASRIMRQSDVAAFARYCQLWQRWRECEDFLSKNGAEQVATEQVRDENGIAQIDAKGQEIRRIVGVCEYPQAMRAIRLAESLTKLEDRFALSPSARASMGNAAMAADKRDSSKSKFFGGA